MKFKCASKSQRGFTLTETLAVVAMSLALGTLAIPALLKITSRYQLQSASRSLESTLQAARFVAILRQGTFGVQISNANHTFEIVQWSGSAWQAMSSGGSNYDVFSSHKIYDPSVTVSTAGLGVANVVAFNSKGELLNASGNSPLPYTSGATMPTVDLTTSAGTYSVSLTRFGNIRVIMQSTGTQL